MNNSLHFAKRESMVIEENPENLQYLWSSNGGTHLLKRIHEKAK
jgi:hypothetical protein